MYKFSIAILSLLTCWAVAPTAGAASCPANTGFLWRPIERPSQNFDIIIVIGQSNAVGAGMGEDGEAADLLGQGEKIFQWGRIGGCDGQVMPADVLQFPGVPADWPLKGMSLPFARRYAASELKPGRNVLVLPSAVAATAILQWTSHVPTGYPGVPVDLYADMIARAQAALKMPGSRVVAVLWHQGESDMGDDSANHISVPGPYAEQVRKLIVTLRKDLSLDGRVPFLLGEPVPAWGADSLDFSARKDSFKAAQQRLAADIPGVAYVESTGLTSNTEDFPNSEPARREQKVHFSARSLTRYGERYYQAFRGLIKTE